ncbi:MAG: diguanylate cyclase [Mycobacteriales bacterium]
MKILAVDSDRVRLLALQAMAMSQGHDCQIAATGREAWWILQQSDIELLVCDRNAEDIDGLQLCRLVRAELTASYVYVIMVTTSDGRDQVKEGMLAGADDYLTKPVAFEDLRRRLIAANRVTTLLRSHERLTREIDTVARSDPLTGLGNRRCLQSDLEVLAARVGRYGNTHSVALLDLDNFTDFNGRYGQAAGDRALKAVAATLANISREGDGCYRFGGGAFLCTYAEQSAQLARIAVDRFRVAVAALGIRHESNAPGGLLTVSAGIAEMTEDHCDPTEVINRCVNALHQAKSLGRDNVESAPS